MRSALAILLACLAAGAALAADPLVLERGDARKGRKLFEEQCAVCHAVAPGQHGHAAPGLHGVVGRKAGTAPGYDLYSPAMTAFGQIWTADALDAYLADPKQSVPKGWMKYPGLPDKYERADLIAFLTEEGLIHRPLR